MTNELMRQQTSQDKSALVPTAISSMQTLETFKDDTITVRNKLRLHNYILAYLKMKAFAFCVFSIHGYNNFIFFLITHPKDSLIDHAS